MSNIRALIVYGTRRGKTQATAAVVGETLILKHRFNVEITDAKGLSKFKHRLGDFDLFIVGSSIMRNRWVWKIIRFLKKYPFHNQQVALFITAGLTLDKLQKYGRSRDEAREEAVIKYIDSYQNKFKFEPLAKTAFGGVYVKAGKQEHDTWNRSEIEQWAKEVGKLAKEQAG